MSADMFTAASVKEYFGLDSHWVSTREGERIHYLDEGPRTGTPIIFIHGSAAGITAASNFYLNIPVAARAGHRAIAPDLYGYGWTEFSPDTEPGVPAWTDQIIRLMNALEIEKAYLVGNSIGGRITTRAALAAPDRILGNIVIGNGGAFWPEPRPRGKGTSREEATEFTREVMKNTVLHFLANPEMASETLIDYRTRMMALAGAAERHAQITKLRNASVKVTRLDIEAAKNCPVPTLIMYGREDRLGPPENALALAEALPNADLVVFGHCGHWSQIERVDEFNMLMLHFVNGYADRMRHPPVRSHDLRALDLETS